MRSPAQVARRQELEDDAFDIRLMDFLSSRTAPGFIRHAAASRLPVMLDLRRNIYIFIGQNARNCSAACYTFRYRLFVVKMMLIFSYRYACAIMPLPK